MWFCSLSLPHNFSQIRNLNKAKLFILSYFFFLYFMITMKLLHILMHYLRIHLFTYLSLYMHFYLYCNDFMNTIRLKECIDTETCLHIIYTFQIYFIKPWDLIPCQPRSRKTRRACVKCFIGVGMNKWTAYLVDCSILVTSVSSIKGGEGGGGGVGGRGTQRNIDEYRRRINISRPVDHCEAIFHKRNDLT